MGHNPYKRNGITRTATERSDLNAPHDVGRRLDTASCFDVVDTVLPLLTIVMKCITIDGMPLLTGLIGVLGVTERCLFTEYRVGVTWF